jgi:hypothetical protein
MSFNESAVPQEFYIRTSDQLLVQPEPQYFYAQLWLGAMRLSLESPGSLGLPGRDVPDMKAPYSTAERDRLMLSNPMFTDVIAAKVNFNAEPGASIRINRPVFANTTYTEASRRIVSGATVSTTATSFGSQQANLQLFGYGGPYDQTNSRIAPFACSKFDAFHSVHSAVQMVGTHHRRDCHKFIDAVQVAFLDLAATTSYPEGVSADNDMTTAGGSPLTFEQVSRTEAAMDQANLPTFADGFRALVITPGQVNDLQMDGDFQRMGQFFPEYNALFPQYVRSVGKFHIFKSTTLTTSTNSSSVVIDYGHAIAPGALLAGMGQPLRVTPNTNDNYGRDILTIWQGDLAFALANSSFVYSVRSAQ